MRIGVSVIFKCKIDKVELIVRLKTSIFCCAFTPYARSNMDQEIVIWVKGKYRSTSNYSEDNYSAHVIAKITNIKVVLNILMLDIILFGIIWRNGKVQIEYIGSKIQLDDFLTKPISMKQFQDSIYLANIRDIGSRGGLEELHESMLHFLQRMFGPQHKTTYAKSLWW